MAIVKLIPDSLQRQARTASPPMPVGSTWLKNHPTNRILSRTDGPTVVRPARIRCHRNALKRLVAANTATAEPNRYGEPFARISAILPASRRDSSTANKPIVTTSRIAVLKNFVIGFRFSARQQSLFYRWISRGPRGRAYSADVSRIFAVSLQCCGYQTVTGGAAAPVRSRNTVDEPIGRPVIAMREIERKARMLHCG